MDGLLGFLSFPRGIFLGDDSRWVVFAFCGLPLLPFLRLGFGFRRGPSTTISICGITFHGLPFSWIFRVIGSTNARCGIDSRGGRWVGSLFRRIVFLPFFLLFDLGRNPGSVRNLEGGIGGKDGGGRIRGCRSFLPLPFFLLFVAGWRFFILSVALPFLLFPLLF